MDFIKYKALFKNDGCKHIYLEIRSDITILSGGKVITSKCLKCGDLEVKRK